MTPPPTDAAFLKLPRSVQRELVALADRLRELAGDDLVSVIVHGSAARGDWSERTSDIDLVVVLARAPRDVLERLGDALALAHATLRVEPMLLVAAEIARSADVFPLYYGDIQAHSFALWGKSPFADLHIEEAHIRLRLEQELRDIAIRLRRQVSEARGEDARLARVVDQALRRARFPLRTLLNLRGKVVAHDLPTILRRAGKLLAVDTLDLARPSHSPGKACDALRALLDAAIAKVDRLEPEAKSP